MLQEAVRAPGQRAMQGPYGAPTGEWAQAEGQYAASAPQNWKGAAQDRGPMDPYAQQGPPYDEQNAGRIPGQQQPPNTAGSGGAHTWAAQSWQQQQPQPPQQQQWQGPGAGQGGAQGHMCALSDADQYDSDGVPGSELQRHWQQQQALPRRQVPPQYVQPDQHWHADGAPGAQVGPGSVPMRAPGELEPPARRLSSSDLPAPGDYQQMPQGPQDALGPQGGQQVEAFGEQEQYSTGMHQQQQAQQLKAPPVPKAGRQVVQCEWCRQLLGVPAKLEPSAHGIQKLRCGKCLKVSKYRVLYLDNSDPILEPMSSAPASQQGSSAPMRSNSLAPGAASELHAGYAPAYNEYAQQGSGIAMPGSEAELAANGYMQHALAGPMRDQYNAAGVPEAGLGVADLGPGLVPGQQWQDGYGAGPVGYSTGAPADAEALSQQVKRMHLSGMPAPHQEQQYGALPQQQQYGMLPQAQLQHYGNAGMLAHGVPQGMPGDAGGGSSQWGRPGPGYPARPSQQWVQPQYAKQEGGGLPAQGALQGADPSAMANPQRSLSGRRTSRPASANVAQVPLPAPRQAPSMRAASEADGPVAPRRTASFKHGPRPAVPVPMEDRDPDDTAARRPSLRPALLSSKSMNRPKDRVEDEEEEEEMPLQRSLTAGKAAVRRIYTMKGDSSAEPELLTRTYTDRRGAKTVVRVKSGVGPTTQLARSNTIGEKDAYNRRVVVNGQPIADRLVAAVEAKVGKIEQGRYWYDPRSGFWGPWGAPLFGAIQGGLKEFGSALPAPDCSAGNSNVFINGRQLQKKELNLLLKKGLPDFSGGKFTLDADGTVGDSAGRPIKNMGKLCDEKKRGMWLKLPGK